MASHTISPQKLNACHTLEVTERPSHYLHVLKGFELLALAATFMAAVQAQIMTTTLGIGRDSETVALSAINSLFLAGFAFSITSALLAFLTARWLQCLTMEERHYFEIAFEAQERLRSCRLKIPGPLRDVEQGLSAQPAPECVQTSAKEEEQPLSRTPNLVHIFFAHTLFVPMILLIVGFVALSLGLLVFAWAEHTLAVGIVVTVVYLVLLPFGIGVFMIGENPDTRLAVINALSRRKGDW